MIGLGLATRVYLAAGATDMRKGFDGLFGIARDRLRIDPLSGHLFVFCNGRRNRLKVLYWTEAGCGSAACVWRKAASVGQCKETNKAGRA
jgi:transposase